jgi:hypothetical protein
MNAIIVTLESEGFPVSVDGGVHRTSTTKFGLVVGFAIVARLEVTRRREVGEGLWKKAVAEHGPTGRRELRVGDSIYGEKLRHRKSENLESLVAKMRSDSQAAPGS